jgi:NifU-like protein involved in Fe-S cluster formation
VTTPLYSLDVLRLAASTANLQRLDNPQASVEKRSPTCGSRVRVDVIVDRDGKVEAVGAELHACALGQASTALMAAHAQGRTGAEIAKARDSLREFLKGEADGPGDWPGLDVFAAARKHSGRHAAILLAFEAAAEAATAAAG